MFFSILPDLHFGSHKISLILELLYKNIINAILLPVIYIYFSMNKFIKDLDTYLSVNLYVCKFTWWDSKKVFSSLGDWDDLSALQFSLLMLPFLTTIYIIIFAFIKFYEVSSYLRFIGSLQKQSNSKTMTCVKWLVFFIFFLFCRYLLSTILIFLPGDGLYCVAYNFLLVNDLWLLTFMCVWNTKIGICILQEVRAINRKKKRRLAQLWSNVGVSFFFPHFNLVEFYDKAVKHKVMFLLKS